MRLKKTSFWIKLLLVIVVVYAVVTLVDLQDRVTVARTEVESLEQQVLYAEQENALAAQELKDLGSEQSVKRIARTRLGMVEAGEIVFFDADAQ